MYILFFTHYLISSADSLEGPRCPHHDRHATGSPTASRPPANADARGLRKMLTPPPLTSEFVGMEGYTPASFHNLVEDEVERDGSSIGDVVAPSHPLS